MSYFASTKEERAARRQQAARETLRAWPIPTLKVGDLVRYDPAWVLACARAAGRSKPDRPMSFWLDDDPGVVVYVHEPSEGSIHKITDVTVEWSWGERTRHVNDGRLHVVACDVASRPCVALPVTVDTERSRCFEPCLTSKNC